MARARHLPPVGADLRADPLVLTIPPMENDRYFSVQLVDAYTFNFGYLGSKKLST